MKNLNALFKSNNQRISKKRLGPLAIKSFLGTAAIIYAIYTVSQIMTFIIKDL
jgi:hypothetical protein